MAEYQGFLVNFISSWYPRLCGIATFTEHTARALSLYEDDILGIKIHPIDKRALTYHFPIKQKHIINQMDSFSWIRAAEMIIGRHRRNEPRGIKTVAILEHEYGLDGNGRDNNYNAIARRLKDADVPNIVVLHTVLQNPDDYQRSVIQEFGDNCNKLVTITPSCKKILEEVYGVDEDKIIHIPHGVPEYRKRMSSRDAREIWGLENRYVVSTIGLLSEGKGVEYGIRGFSRFLRGIEPEYRDKAVYLIVGETHPEILEKRGDYYRRKLFKIAESEGLDPIEVSEKRRLDFRKNNVIFINKYLPIDEYIEIITASHVMLLPYVNLEQVSSGNLAYSIGLETPVVATSFRYAIDMFSDKQGNPDGSGVLVKPSDDDEIARGLRDVFENLVEIGTKAYLKGSTMRWSVVGKQYVNALYDVALKRSEVQIAKIPFLKREPFTESDRKGAKNS
jgi:glycosyltransferase involved in cell wall biosynthesis